jgi:predicted RNase H-like HicB family nuclease
MGGGKVKTYVFRVVVKPDEDRWQAYCPTLEEYAAYTWGYTREGAIDNIKEVIEMVLAELSEDGLPVPQEPVARGLESSEHRVAVSI